MVLVSGILADEMVELMCARLAHMGCDYCLLDQLQFPGECQVSWELGNGAPTGYIRCSGLRVPLSDITGIYVRYVDYRGPSVDTTYTAREQDLIKAEYQLSLMWLFDVMPCTVVSRARHSISNDSKLYQSDLCRSFGFSVPRTIATTIPEEALAFYEACSQRVIFKSLSGIRSVVRRLQAADLPRLALLPNCPTQFQQYVEGVDIRVHTVADETFATEVVSSATDYRYAGRQGADLSIRPVTLPDHVAAACKGLAKACGLAVAGIDLRRASDDTYYCFEVNPSPGFIFYERSTGQPISEAVAKLLQRTEC